MTNQSRVSIALAIIFICYAVWAASTANLLQSIYGTSCSQSFFTVSCDFARDTAVVSLSYPALLVFLLLLAGAARLWWRNSAAYPFLKLSVILCAGAALWDIIAQQPVLFGPKIINDTINVLGAVIAASFTLLIMLCRAVPFSLFRLFQAAAISYGLTALSVAAFVELSLSVFGVTELFLLYVIYAFGSFTLHLMTVCGFVSGLPLAAARVQAK